MDQKLFSENIKKYIKKISSNTQTISWVVIAVAMIATIFFMYFDCYKTIRRSTIVTVLKKQVAVNVVNIELWEKINKDIKWKKNNILGDVFNNNPFE